MLPLATWYLVYTCMLFIDTTLFICLICVFPILTAAPDVTNISNILSAVVVDLQPLTVKVSFPVRKHALDESANCDRALIAWYSLNSEYTLSRICEYSYAGP